MLITVNSNNKIHPNAQIPKKKVYQYIEPNVNADEESAVKNRALRNEGEKYKIQTLLFV